MVGQSRTFHDPYRPRDEERKEFYDKNKYLTAVGALLYLSTYTRPDISLATSVFARLWAQYGAHILSQTFKTLKD